MPDKHKVVLQTTYHDGIDVHGDSVIHTCMSHLKIHNRIHHTH